jgi:hypothetical protein
MDHLNDTSLQRFHSLSKQFLPQGLPEFVKAAGIDTVRPKPGAPLSVYGDPARRQFPCHDKVATWLSCLYFWGDRANDVRWDSPCPTEVVANRLEKSARYWGILPDVLALRGSIKEKSAAAERKLTDQDYALAVNYGAEHVRRFPLVNAETVKKAAANIRKFRISYPYAWRKQAAVNTLKKAMEFNAQLSLDDLDYLVKASGAYPADSSTIASQLRCRALVMPEDIKTHLRKAADVVEKSGAKDLNKLCLILDSIDRTCKKYAMYNAGMPMPEEVCYSGLEVKQASTDDTITLTTGQCYKLADIDRAGIEPFTVLDPVYVQELAADDSGKVDMSKAAVILPTIPRNDAALLEKALKATGVGPTEKTARRNLNKDFTLDALCALLGPPADDYSRSFRLKHPQSQQPTLDKINS